MRNITILCSVYLHNKYFFRWVLSLFLFFLNMYGCSTSFNVCKVDEVIQNHTIIKLYTYFRGLHNCWQNKSNKQKCTLTTGVWDLPLNKLILRFRIYILFFVIMYTCMSFNRRFAKTWIYVNYIWRAVPNRVIESYLRRKKVQVDQTINHLNSQWNLPGKNYNWNSFLLVFQTMRNPNERYWLKMKELWKAFAIEH